MRENWFSYLATVVGTMGISFALVLGYMSYRDDTLLVKYGECSTSHTKMALKMANMQAAFLDGEVKSTGELLQCRHLLSTCKSRLPKPKPKKVKKYKKKVYKKRYKKK